MYTYFIGGAQFEIEETLHEKLQDRMLHPSVAITLIQTIDNWKQLDQFVQHKITEQFAILNACRAQAAPVDEPLERYIQDTISQLKSRDTEYKSILEFTRDRIRRYEVLRDDLGYNYNNADTYRKEQARENYSTVNSIIGRVHFAMHTMHPIASSRRKNRKELETLLRAK